MIKLIDARKGLHEKCVELFNNDKVAESIYMYLCDGIEECDAVEPDLSSYSDKLWRNAYERGRAEAELIRCKDCKWKQGAGCVKFAEIRVFPDDFCSRAERREE